MKPELTPRLHKSWSVLDKIQIINDLFTSFNGTRHVALHDKNEPVSEVQRETVI